MMSLFFLVKNANETETLIVFPLLSFVLVSLELYFDIYINNTSLETW